MSNYDHYADQLLNSAFENAKQSIVSSSPLPGSPEDQLFNQLLARMSSSAPYNEWLLLQQLQQHKQQLLERQQLLSGLSPTALAGLLLSMAQPSSNNHDAVLDADTDVKVVKKIARVPVQAAQSSSATLSKPNKTEENALRRESMPPQPLVLPSQEHVFTAKKRAKSMNSEPNHSQQQAKITREKPTGWWKGKNRESASHQQQQLIDSQQEENDTPVVAKHTTSKKTAVKRVAVVVPRKVPSISKPKRPVAFKTPTSRNPKSNSFKKKKDEATTTTQPAAAGIPMYVMPQQQPMYHPQQTMMQGGGHGNGNGGGYYMMSPNGTVVGQSQQHYEEKVRPVSFSGSRKSVYNPRESSNDKCSIM